MTGYTQRDWQCWIFYDFGVSWVQEILLKRLNTFLFLFVSIYTLLYVWENLNGSFWIYTLCLKLQCIKEEKCMRAQKRILSKEAFYLRLHLKSFINIFFFILVSLICVYFNFYRNIINNILNIYLVSCTLWPYFYFVF